MELGGFAYWVSFHTSTRSGSSLIRPLLDR